MSMIPEQAIYDDLCRAAAKLAAYPVEDAVLTGEDRMFIQHTLNGARDMQGKRLQIMKRGES